jgi:hypothetical protein
MIPVGLVFRAPPSSAFRAATEARQSSQGLQDCVMKLTHKFAELTPEKRPQDLHLDGTGLQFETLEHGGEYPDTMPQAIKLIDADGRSCIYVPITQNGKVVDSLGHALELDDE